MSHSSVPENAFFLYELIIKKLLNGKDTKAKNKQTLNTLQNDLQSVTFDYEGAEEMHM